LSVACKHFQLVDTINPLPDSLIFGKTEAMEAVRHKVECLAGTSTPILIQGESGTGKEVLATAIHARSCGKSAPFFKITCPAIPAHVPEEHSDERGPAVGNGSSVFTTDWIDSALGGTLFFDEIHELPLPLQARLLELLQDSRLGCVRTTTHRVPEVQVICTTNRNLEVEIGAERFRRDLFYRINVFTIELLPLRQRLEDIPDIVEDLLRSYAAKHNPPQRMISPQLLELMQRHKWPGNIRELENLIRRFVILGSEQAIGSELLAKISADLHPEETSGNISLKKLTRQAAFELERRVILKALEAHGWNRKRAARSLNISYRALLYKIKQGGMPPKRNGAVRPAVQLVAED
jgi:two-component system, NtrC family, response regulator AtoC